jgi:hypothetical protein
VPRTKDPIQRSVLNFENNFAHEMSAVFENLAVLQPGPKDVIQRGVLFFAKALAQDVSAAIECAQGVWPGVEDASFFLMWSVFAFEIKP